MHELLFFVWFVVNILCIVIGRLGRSSVGYGGSRSSISSQDSHGMYSSRQGMTYSGSGGWLISNNFMFNITISSSHNIQVSFMPYIFIICGVSGSYGGSDVGGMYSSSYGGDYMPRGNDVYSFNFPFPFLC